MGRLLLNSVKVRDLSVVMAGVCVFCPGGDGHQSSGGFPLHGLRPAHSLQFMNSSSFEAHRTDPEVGDISEARRPRYRWVWRLRKSPTGLLGSVTVVFVVTVALLASVIVPHDPEKIDLKNRLAPPIWAEGGTGKYLLGTDQLGRDVLSRIILGTRISLMVGIVGVLLAMVTGVFLGVTSGFLGGWWDMLVSRTLDTFLAIPSSSWRWL